MFFTVYYNALCRFNSNILNIVLSQCVVLVQMALSMWQIQTTLLQTLGASFLGVWCGAWSLMGCSDIVPKTLAARSSSVSVPLKVTPKSIPSKSTSTPSEAKIDQQKVDKYWDHEETVEWKKQKSGPHLSIADHEGSDIMALVWRDAPGNTSHNDGASGNGGHAPRSSDGTRDSSSDSGSSPSSSRSSGSDEESPAPPFKTCPNWNTFNSGQETPKWETPKKKKTAQEHGKETSMSTLAKARGDQWVVVSKTPSSLMGAFSQFKASSQSWKHPQDSTPESHSSTSDDSACQRKPAKKKGCWDHQHSDSSNSNGLVWQKKKKAKELSKEDAEKAAAERRHQNAALKKAMAQILAQKYDLECQSLWDYWAKKMDRGQLHCCNTDDHSAYLDHIQHKFRSLYPYGHVTDVSNVIHKLDSNLEFLQTEQIRAGLGEIFQKSSDNASQWSDNDNVTAKYLMQVLLDVQGTKMMVDHLEYGGSQNIGLHDLVGPRTIAWKVQQSP